MIEGQSPVSFTGQGGYSAALPCVFRFSLSLRACWCFGPAIDDLGKGLVTEGGMIE
jgi:hypothetical protein